MPSTAGGFSAVAYFFARELHLSKGVPIGIVNSSYGGSRIEAWMSDDMLGFDESVRLANGETERQPTVIYNKMIHPIVGFPLAGVIWYQGESNADNLADADGYRPLFRTLITGWRALWNDPTLPFLWVQLPNFSTPTGSTPGLWDAWPRVRDGRFVWAQATVIDSTVRVWNANVPEPIQIRYAWEANPDNSTLRNTADLPGAPFKTYVNPGFAITTFEANKTDIEPGQSAALTWLAFGSQSVTLNGEPVDSIGSVTVQPTTTTDYVLRAMKRGAGDILERRLTVTVLDPAQINRALERSVWASSSQNGIVPGYAVDGSTDTQWMSASGESGEWLTVDLGMLIEVDRVDVSFGGASPDYRVETSLDSYIWSPGTTGLAMHVRVHAPFITEFGVYGTLSDRTIPSVNVAGDKGNVVTTGSVFAATASAAAPGNAIRRVRFFVDGEPAAIDSIAPFQLSQPFTGAGLRRIAAEVTDTSALTIRSAEFLLHVVSGTITRHEAENAELTGTANVISLVTASNRKFVDLQDGWTVGFPSVTVPETGDYLLIFAHRMSYQSPKHQYLDVNGEWFGTLVFTAPNTSTWMQQAFPVRLTAGANRVVLDGFWDWMALDYMAVVVPSTGVGLNDDTDTRPGATRLGRAYPNPFNPETTVPFELGEMGPIRLSVYDLTGRKVRILADGTFHAGLHEVRFKAEGLASGVYLIRLETVGGAQSTKLLLLK